MDTLVSAACRHRLLSCPTVRRTEFVDLTPRLEQFVGDCGLRLGTLHLQTTHTTTGVVVNEQEPLLQCDLEALLDRLAPRRGAYWHDELSLRRGIAADEPRNGHAHCQALLLPTSVCLAVSGGRLVLGRWQRVFLVELDGPRTRTVSAMASGEMVA